MGVLWKGIIVMHDDDIPRYKKKSQKKPPSKANHKHEYTYCVYGYNELKFARERGFEPKPTMSIGTYCPICGKVGSTSQITNDLWAYMRRDGCRLYGADWNDAAKREFNEETRTLPYFWIDDRWRQKYVEVG